MRADLKEKKEERTGEVETNNQGDIMKIVEYMELIK